MFGICISQYSIILILIDNWNEIIAWKINNDGQLTEFLLYLYHSGSQREKVGFIIKPYFKLQNNFSLVNNKILRNLLYI